MGLHRFRLHPEPRRPRWGILRIVVLLLSTLGLMAWLGWRFRSG